MTDEALDKNGIDTSLRVIFEKNYIEKYFSNGSSSRYNLNKNGILI